MTEQELRRALELAARSVDLAERPRSRRLSPRLLGAASVLVLLLPVGWLVSIMGPERDPSPDDGVRVVTDPEPSAPQFRAVDALPNVIGLAEGEGIGQVKVAGPKVTTPTRIEDCLGLDRVRAVSLAPGYSLARPLVELAVGSSPPTATCKGGDVVFFDLYDRGRGRVSPDQQARLDRALEARIVAQMDGESFAFRKANVFKGSGQATRFFDVLADQLRAVSFAADGSESLPELVAPGQNCPDGLTGTVRFRIGERCSGFAMVALPLSGLPPTTMITVTGVPLRVDPMSNARAFVAWALGRTERTHFAATVTTSKPGGGLGIAAEVGLRNPRWWNVCPSLESDCVAQPLRPALLSEDSDACARRLIEGAEFTSLSSRRGRIVITFPGQECAALDGIRVQTTRDGRISAVFLGLEAPRMPLDGE